MGSAIPRARVFNLRPRLPIPFPSVSFAVNACVTAKKHNTLPCDVCHHREIAASAWSYIVELSPEFTVPFPGITEKARNHRITAKEQDLFPNRVERHTVSNTCARTGVLLLRPEQ